MSERQYDSANGADLKPVLSATDEEYAGLNARKAIDPSTGSRNYMGGVGLFLSRAGFAQQRAGEHPYGYAANNPVMYLDPTGLFPRANCPGNRQRERQINLAVQNLCRALQASGLAAIANSGCVTHDGSSSKQGQCLLDWCKQGCVACGNIKTCNDNSWCGYSHSGYGAQCPKRCVYICPQSWDSPGCSGNNCSSALRATILHEMISVCGSQHKGGSAHGDEDVCENRAQCLCRTLHI